MKFLSCTAATLAFSILSGLPALASCDAPAISAARQKLQRAIVDHDQLAAMLAASEGFNAENPCIEDLPATVQRSKHVVSFAEFTIYGYAYGGHRRDFLDLGKSFVDHELTYGSPDARTRRRLESLKENLMDKLRG